MKLVTVVYEVVNEEEWGKTNPPHYAHNGLLAKTMQISLEELSGTVSNPNNCFNLTPTVQVKQMLCRRH